MTLNWQSANDYSYTQSLSPQQWAWEFLRRNPDYQQDWHYFIQRWQALETDYGKAPNRNFARWKNDPRAVVSKHEAALICHDDLGIACAIEDDKILIECWMGAKWGFYKFPLNPDYCRPKIPEELLWREQEISLQNIANNHHQAYVTALHFDLRLSLKEQLEAARIQLANTRRQLYKAGKIKPRVRDNCHYWTYLLRYADAIQADVNKHNAEKILQHESSITLNTMKACLDAMWHRGYLDIVLMQA